MSSVPRGLRLGFDRCAFERGRAHDGTREISFARVLEREGAPLRFMDLVTVPPGADIGLHTHASDNEEIYVIVSGTGRMTLDGEEFQVNPGDVVVNRPGGTHGLQNGSGEEMRIVVIEVRSTLERVP